MFTTRDLNAAGLSRQEIDELRRANVRIKRGHYGPAQEDPWDQYRDLCLATVADLKAGALLTGPSAAALLRLPLPGPPPEEVFVRGLTRGQYGPTVRVLNGPARPAEGFNEPLIAPRTAAADCARLLSRRDAMIVADGLTHAGFCSVQELEQEAEESLGTHRAERVRWMARNVDPNSESPGETWTRLLLHALGFRLLSQVEVSSGGRALRLDFVVEGTTLAIEFDGAVKYSATSRLRAEIVIRNERQRQAALEAAGYDFLRLIWEHLFDPDRLALRLRAKGVVPQERPWPISPDALLTVPNRVRRRPKR